MLKSLQMKLVLILMLLVVAVMAVVGVFLVNSVTAYNRSDFQRQMVDFFALRGQELDKGLSACNGDLDQMEEVLEAYNGGLGWTITGISIFWMGKPGSSSPRRKAGTPLLSGS